MNQTKLLYVILGIIILVIFINGCAKYVEQTTEPIVDVQTPDVKEKASEPTIKTVTIDTENPLILCFSDYEHHGIGHTAYFFEDGTVIRKSTGPPTVPCEVHEGKLSKESLNALKTWLKEISIENVDFGASPSSTFIVLENNQAKYIFEDAMFYSDFYNKFLFHSLENEKILNCDDYDLSPLKDQWKFSKLIDIDYDITVTKKEIDEIAQKLYGSVEYAYYENEIYAVFIDGNIYYLLANSQIPRELLFLDRDLTLKDGTLVDQESILKQTKNAKFVYILKLNKNHNTNNYEIYSWGLY